MITILCIWLHLASYIMLLYKKSFFSGLILWGLSLMGSIICTLLLYV